MRKPFPTSYIEKGTRTGWGRGGFTVTGQYIPPQPHIGPYWKKFAGKLALRLAGASAGSIIGLGLTGYEVYNYLKKRNMQPSRSTQRYSIFPKRTFAEMMEVEGQSNFTDPTAKSIAIGNAKQYVKAYSKSKGKRRVRLKDVINQLKTFKTARFSSYNTNDFINPENVNRYSASMERKGLTYPLNSIHNTAVDEQIMPVYAFNLSALVRNHRRTGSTLQSWTDPLNTYPAIHACPAYRLIKAQPMTNAVFPKYRWECIPGIHNGYTTNSYPTDAANIPMSYTWNITDTDYTNKPVHNYTVDWASIKSYFYGCNRPRTVCTSLGFFTDAGAAPLRQCYKRNDNGTWGMGTFDIYNVTDLDQDIALYYEQWMASILGHPFDKPINRIKDTANKQFIKFFKKETINLGCDTTINKDGNQLQVFKSHFRKDGKLRKTYDEIKTFQNNNVQDEVDYINTYLNSNVTHPRNDDTMWDVTTDATNFGTDGTKDIYYFVWVKDQGEIYQEGTFTGEVWNTDKAFLCVTDKDVTFDIDIKIKNTTYPDLSH